ncbi:hypothetical protein CR203_13895 [Salipaludibacillus neizhouensis]|uniref:DUF624 domain-containing protein n=2 Tax=Salipaludibacillus neizhouensis TaxID=885475 RepID=A0A3A9K2H3_9BACI|nr:DUF624 domain-containing protein [Salipaludibacillus neizhouensis]RKL66917.1 hypothetical protein CR203_13895 [Salipaludibacillus neizhouensis]
MQLGGLMGGIYKISDMVMKLAYLNILWFLGVLSGLVVFGIMPATVSLFSVIRGWILNDDEMTIHKKFIETYKKDFFPSNILGLIILFVGYGFFINYQFLGSMNEESSLTLIILVGNILVAILLGIFLLFIFPIYVHFDMSLLKKIKLSVMLGIIYPHITLVFIITVFLFCLLFTFIPALIFFFSVSGVAYCLMGIYMKKINDIAEKYNRKEQVLKESFE